jgi:hypothetical protein
MTDARAIWEHYTTLAGGTTFHPLPPSGGRPDVTTADLAQALGTASGDALAVDLALAKACASAASLRKALPDAARRVWIDLCRDRRLAPMLTPKTARVVLVRLVEDVFGELLTGCAPNFARSAQMVRMRRENYRRLYDAACAVLSALADDAAEEGWQMLG